MSATGALNPSAHPNLAPPLRSGSILLVDDPRELCAILAPDVNLCVWRRTVPSALIRFVDEVLMPCDLKRLAAGAVEAPVLDALLEGLPPSEGHDCFRQDLLTQVRLYADVTGATRVHLKLECFGSNLCERFHVDWVPLRLICSYAGPGTEWLDNRDIDRAWLGPRAGDLPDEASGLLLPGARIGQLDRFSVGLMKGDRWPGNAGKAVVHRSPRIVGTGCRRVLFKIDTETRAG